ncbi:MAG: efflux RND transporter periplasmic adaptor subunit [Salinimicrobium sp.]
MNTVFKNIKIRLLLIFIPGLLLSSCNSSSGEEKAKPEAPSDLTEMRITEPQFKGSGMELGELQLQQFTEKVTANGMIDVPPENKASVSVYFGGYVKRLQLLPGQKVNRGQVLLMLENPEYLEVQRDFLEEKGRLKYLKSDYERQKNLASDNVASEKQFLKAESEYKMASAKYQSLRKKLQLMGINPEKISEENLQSNIMVLSPISGYVSKVNTNLGSYLDASDVGVELINPEHLHLELQIFEKDLPKVKEGQKIMFNLQDDPSKKYEATVHLVGKAVETQSRTISVHAHLVEEEQKELFNPGMYIESEIETASQIMPSLPANSVVDIDNKHYVLLLENSNSDGMLFKKKEVQLGPQNDDYIAIENAGEFPENAQFLTKGAFNLITE